MNKHRTHLVLLALALTGCGTGEPRFGVISISQDSPRATLTGRTTAQASPAMELSPGCPGYIDPSVPEHVLHVADGVPLTVHASSAQGPLAIAVSGAGEVRCDSDQGTGHSPRVVIETAGDYIIHIGALQNPLELAYELVVEPSADAQSAGGTTRAADTRVSVTVTSDPPGATVRTPEGELLGTTPAMFVLNVHGEDVGEERRFVLEMPGHASTEVTGRLLGGSLTLHAALPTIGAVALADTPPTNLPNTPGAIGAQLPSVSASTTDNPLSIRDFTTVEQHAEITTDCTIGGGSIDLNLQHSYVGDLRVALRSPQGTEVVLHNHAGGSRSALVTSFDWNARRGVLHPLAGENARGRWSLIVRDSVGADTGTLNSFALHFTCGAAASSAPVEAQTPAGGQNNTAPTGPARRRTRTSAGVVDPWASRTPPPPQPPMQQRRVNGPAANPNVIEPW